jgi:hypothetical protein
LLNFVEWFVHNHSISDWISQHIFPALKKKTLTASPRQSRTVAFAMTVALVPVQPLIRLLFS